MFGLKPSPNYSNVLSCNMAAPMGRAGDFSQAPEKNHASVAAKPFEDESLAENEELKIENEAGAAGVHLLSRLSLKLRILGLAASIR